MKLSDEARARAALWMDYVVRDMEATRHLRDLPRMEPIVCFHAQQAAEKALTAYLAALSEDRYRRPTTCAFSTPSWRPAAARRPRPTDCCT